MRPSLDRIDGIESEIAASIDRFAEVLDAKLRCAIEQNTDHAKATPGEPSPYLDNGSVTG